MKRLLLTMTALAAVAGAAPAVAQYYPQSDSRYYPQTSTRAMTSAEFRDRFNRLEMRLNAGLRSGDISRSEELTLRRQLANLRQLERQYSYNGLNWREQQNLLTQLRAVRQNINYADSGRLDRDNRYSWYDDAYTGMGGPMEVMDACADRGGSLGGVFNSLLGRSCLRVGDLANRNMFVVPNAYRNQYRDTPDVFYRYDGNLIYAIDPRTNRVVASWDID